MFSGENRGRERERGKEQIKTHMEGVRGRTAGVPQKGEGEGMGKESFEKESLKREKQGERERVERKTFALFSPFVLR